MSDSDTLSAAPPFAVWRVFRGLPRCYFAFGCPPTIAELSGWPRVLHVSVLLAAIGLVATGCGLIAVWGLMQAGFHDPWDSGSLGLAIGFFLLFPLSRWIERPLWLALLAIPASTLWFGTLNLWWEAYGGGQSSGLWQEALIWWATTTTMGVGLGLWMLSPSQRQTWWMPVIIVAICAVAAVINGSREWLVPNGLALPIIGGPLLNFVLRVQPIVFFVTLTSAALGMRLWIPERREPTPVLPWTDAFAVWTVFRGLPGWYFARGLPPPLAHESLTIRSLRTTVLFGAMGLASSWISTFWLFGERLVLSGSSIRGEGTLVFSPGAWFGLLVLVPLSRWIGRGWFASGLLVPISTAVYFGAVHLYLRNIFSSDSSTILRDGVMCGLWGGFGVSVWFIKLRRPRTWLLVPWMAIIGGLVTWGMAAAPSPERPSLPFGLDWLMELFAMNLLLSPFQVAVATALGARLWWEPTPSVEKIAR